MSPHREKRARAICWAYAVPQKALRLAIRTAVLNDNPRTKPYLKVLFVSGYTGDAMLQSGSFPPGTAFLQKPFTLGSLLGKVREVLDATLGASANR